MSFIPRKKSYRYSNRKCDGSGHPHGQWVVAYEIRE